MPWLDRVERRIGRFAVQRLTLVMILAWVAAFFMLRSSVDQAHTYEAMILNPRLVFAGEWWRVFSFVFVPPAFGNALFFLIAMLFYFTIGSALEEQLGAFKYNCLVFLSWGGAVLGMFLPYAFAVAPSPEAMIMASGLVFVPVFLAFAGLFPNFVVLLMFILPVKMKWLAYIALAWLGYMLLVGDAYLRSIVLCTNLSYFALFGGEISRRVRRSGRQLQQSAQERRQEAEPFHRCTTCAVTEKKDPERSFRICDLCLPPAEYCDLHLKDHEHRQAPVPVPEKAPSD